ncbi:MAG: helix-turn-helix domain-containing protein [Cellulosilyticaceae bacterium]
MIDIPKIYYKKDTVHRIVGNNPLYGNISCGFLHKTSKKESNYNTVFENYGGLLLLDGKGVHVNDKGESFPVYPGCFIQRIPGKLHHTYVEGDGKWLEFFICFGKDIFENMVNLGMATREEDVLYPGVSYGVIQTFSELLQKFKQATDKEMVNILFECQQIVYQMFVHHQMRHDNEDESLKESCNVLKQYSTSRVPLESVCKELNVGYEVFRKVFKEKIGISPNRYIVQQRINLAKTMLLDSQCAIKEIAIQLGYSDSFAFSKQFKDFTGVSPREFRKIY